MISETIFHIEAEYKTLDLIDDLIQIDRQFYKLHGDLGLKVYSSLLRRVSDYASHRKDDERSTEYTKVLNHLHAVVRSQVCSLKEANRRRTSITFE